MEKFPKSELEKFALHADFIDYFSDTLLLVFEAWAMFHLPALKDEKTTQVKTNIVEGFVNWAIKEKQKSLHVKRTLGISFHEGRELSRRSGGGLSDAQTASGTDNVLVEKSSELGG